jgi:hypothetical protein
MKLIFIYIIDYKYLYNLPSLKRNNYYLIALTRSELSQISSERILPDIFDTSAFLLNSYGASLFMCILNLHPGKFAIDIHMYLANLGALCMALALTRTVPFFR